ncbi:MAG: transporter substrate-binding domain-containing protein [Emcibacteraceae bacterium]
MIILLMNILSLSAYSQSVPETPKLTIEESEWIKAHPTIRAANISQYVPFNFSRDGEARGFSVDILKLTAEKVGLNVSFAEPATWPEALEKIKNNEIDVFHSISEDFTRDQFLNFTSPYIESYATIYGHVGMAQIQSAQDLKGKKIGVVRGSIYANYYTKNYSDLTLIEYPDSVSVVMALANNDVDLITASSVTVDYYIAQNFISGLKNLSTENFIKEFENEQLRLASRKDQPILRDILDKGIKAISNNELEAIANKWQIPLSSQQTINLSPQERAWLSAHPVINVSTDPQLEPIEFINKDGKIDGIAGDFLDLIAHKLNVTFKWSGTKNFSEGIERTLSGETHIISAIAPTPEREKEFFLTSNYLSANHMIFARDDAAIFGNIEGLAGKTLVQVKGYTVNQWINHDYPEIKKIEVDTIGEAIKMISAGKADAFISDILTTSHYISHNGFANIIVVGQTEFKGDTVMGISRRYLLLASAINKAMESITPMERNQISQKWQSLKLENGTDFTLVRNVSIIAVIILAAILIWNNRLRKEISRRRTVEKKLRQAQIIAENANAAKSAFLANMSHEIRTPLNAIIGFSEAMIAGIGGPLTSPKHREYLNDIKSSGEHLAVVIKDILDLSKIEAGKWVLNEKIFSLDESIKKSIKMLKQNSREKNVTITYDSKEKIDLIGDQNAVVRILINLLSNAVKFVDYDGLVEITTTRNKNGSVSVEIKDNGIGIPKDRLEMVLNPFEQIESNPELQVEGTGLGLSIVQKLIELHGGLFALDSEINVGTSATITFPAARICANAA